MIRKRVVSKLNGKEGRCKIHALQLKRLRFSVYIKDEHKNFTA